MHIAEKNIYRTENVTIVARAGNKVHGNLCGCKFILFHNHIEISVIVKRMVYHAYVRVLPQTHPHA